MKHRAVMPLFLDTPKRLLHLFLSQSLVLKLSIGALACVVFACGRSHKKAQAPDFSAPPAEKSTGDQNPAVFFQYWQTNHKDICSLISKNMTTNKGDVQRSSKALLQIRIAIDQPTTQGTISCSRESVAE